MTSSDLKALFDINVDDVSYYDIEQIKDDGKLEDFFKAITRSQVESMMFQIRKEFDELNDEYHNGDSLCYPPDWWDQYVFPIDNVLSILRDHHETLVREEESSEDY
jgi:hypothetical protein